MENSKSETVRVLLVEDNFAEARLIQETLKELQTADFRIIHVDRLQKALERLGQNEIDVILLDLSLPDVQGLETVERTLTAAPHLPIVVLTGLDDETIAANAVKAGAQDYFVKGQADGNVLARAMRYAITRKRAEVDLQDSERRYRLLFESNPHPMWVYDLDTFSFLAVNDAAVAHYGFSRDEFISMTIKDIRPPEDIPRLVENVTRVAKGVDEAGIWRHLKKDGTIIDVEITSHTLIFGGRKAELVLANDVTERKRAEEALREQARISAFNSDVGMAITQDKPLPVILQACSEAMVAHLGAAFARIWTFNKDTDVLELQASAGMYTHLNGSHGRVPVGKFKIGLIAQERQPHLTNDVVHDPRVGDQGWARKEGMVAFAGYPLIIAEQLVGVMAIFARAPLKETVLQAMSTVAGHIALEIHRHHTEKALRMSEQKYRALFEESKDVVFISTPEGKFLDINPAGVELFGYSSKEELLQIDIGRDLYGDPEQRKRHMERLRRNGYLKDCENSMRRKDGTKLVVLETSTAIKDENGHLIALRGIMRDITHMTDLQHQFLQSQKMEAIGQLAGGVAHDFNNTLMAISGYSELLMMKLKEDDPNRRMASEIQRATAQSAGLTRQLLAFSRRQILAPKILALNESISAMQDMLQRLIGEDIELQVSHDMNLGFMKVDPGQIEQVILNLAINARDAMPRGGRLVIHTSNVELDEQYAASHVGVSPGPYILLAIDDTGTGMDEATLSRVFEPFFTTKPEGKGTGLGLSTVYGIVKQSDGHIWAYSQPGLGTSFKIYFPRIDEWSDRQIPPLHISQDITGRGETIFLVDDNESVRTALAALLTQKGYNIVDFDHGVKALEWASHSNRPIDLLITDVVMPEINGRELAERMRIARPGIKVLFMSGYTVEAISRHGVLDANSAFLSKPATMEALLLKIRELLDSEARTSETSG